jgi:PAS domain S-box-containing protein
MSKNQTFLLAAEELRRRAEDRLRKRLDKTGGAPKSEADDQRLLHELQVHQIELEMQNDNLRMAYAELDSLRARYFDLYDLAPVGYCTLSEKGLILEANLIAATLLGVSRSTLIHRPISQFILKEDQDMYYLHRKQLFETGKSQACDLRMVKNDGTVFWAHLEAATAQNENGEPLFRIIIGDVSKNKQAEEELKTSEVRYQQLARHLDAVLENEHKYFARELHDDLGQTLTALKIDLASLKAECTCSDSVKNKMDAMQNLLSEGILNIHSICRRLRPGALDDLGLGEALAGMTDD